MSTSKEIQLSDKARKALEENPELKGVIMTLGGSFEAGLNIAVACSRIVHRLGQILREESISSEKREEVEVLLNLALGTLRSMPDLDKTTHKIVDDVVGEENIATLSTFSENNRHVETLVEHGAMVMATTVFKIMTEWAIEHTASDELLVLTGAHLKVTLETVGKLIKLPHREELLEKLEKLGVTGNPRHEALRKRLEELMEERNRRISGDSEGPAKDLFGLRS